MLAFMHPDLFGAVSSVAGAVVDWEEEPLKRALECTFGDADDPFSRIYFQAWHPALAACRNASRIIASKQSVRLAVGDADRLYDENGNKITDRFHNLLDRLGIPHTYTIVPGANHNPKEIFADSVNRYDFGFWDSAFASSRAEVELPEEIRQFADSMLNATPADSLSLVKQPNGNLRHKRSPDLLH